MAQAKLRYKLVSPEEFYRSEYFLGKEAKALRPYWYDRLCEYFHGNHREFIFSGSSRAGKCVLGSTRIATEDGYLPIQEVAEKFGVNSDGYVPVTGLNVCTPSGVKSVSHIYREADSEVLFLTSRSDVTVNGTPEHKVMSSIDGKAPAMHTLQELADGPGACLSFSLEPVEFPRQPFSEEVFYAIGKWIGDGGCIRLHDVLKGYYFLSASKESVLQLKEALALPGVVATIDFSARTNPTNKNPMYKVLIPLKHEVFNQFIDGYCNAYDKHVPDKVFRSSVSQRCAFLQGILDTDGWVEKGGWHFSTASERLRDEVCELFQSLGFVCSKKFKLATCQGKRFPEYILAVLPMLMEQYAMFDFPFSVKKVKLAGPQSIQYHDTVYLDDASITEVQALPLYRCSHSDREKRNYNRYVYRLLAQAKAGYIKRELLMVAVYRWGFSLPNCMRMAHYCNLPIKSVDRTRATVYDLTVPDGHLFYAQGLVNHNTYAASLLLLYYIYSIYCYEDFPAMFGLSSSTLPKIMWFSFSRAKADSTGISRLIRMVDNIPFFNDHPMRKRRPITSILSFPWIEVYSGTNVNHAIGDDVLGAVIDEANVRHVSKSRELEEAHELFMELRMRSATTFVTDGKWGGFAGIISTAGSTSSFVDSELAKARQDGSKFYVSAAVYDVNPQAFSKEKFPVFCGDGDTPAFIVDEAPDSVVKAIAEDTGISLAQFLKVHEADVVQVPENLRRFYQEDVNTAIRNLSGRTSLSSSSLFNKKSVITSIFDPVLKNPCDDNLPYFGIFDTWSFDEHYSAEALWRYYDGEPVYVHIDLSKKWDRTGFCALFWSTKFQKVMPVWVTALYYNRDIPDNEIDHTKVFELLGRFRAMGVNIRYVSTDHWGDQYFILQAKKLLGQQGAGYQSVDKDPGAYLNLLNSARVRMLWFYPYEILRHELSELQYDSFTGKVDHLPNSDPHSPAHSKDVADAVSGALASLFNFEGISYQDAFMPKESAMTAPEPMEDEEAFYEDVAEDSEDFYSGLEDAPSSQSSAPVASTDDLLSAMMSELES